MRLLAVADTAEILASGRFLSVASEIGPSDVMMIAEFAAAQARKVGFSAIGAGAINAVAASFNPASTTPHPAIWTACVAAPRSRTARVEP
jgi:hypothetical protein